MAKLDICTCMVQLNERTIVARTENNPLNYAEVEMLRFTLGERAIDDLVVIRTEESDNQTVLENLRLKFSYDTVATAFPGTRPRLPMEAPSDVRRLTEIAEKPRGKPSKAKPAPVAPVAADPEETSLGDVFDAEEDEQAEAS